MPNRTSVQTGHRRWSARTVALALTALMLLSLLPTPAVAQADVDAAEAAAAAWLVGAYADGEVTTGGGLADLIFALSGAQAAPDTIAAALADLEALAADYVGGDDLDEGPVAKGLLGVLVAGGDGTDVDGIDLEAELRAMMQTDGDDAGRFDDANVFTQSLAIMALAATGAGAPAEATAWLAERRCPDGGWTFGLADSIGDGTGITIPCMTAGEGDVDTTALAVQALLADPAQDATRDGAVAWLADQQSDNGSFGDNANSTGLAAQALRATGDIAAADAAAQFVTTLQYGPEADEAGAIRFTADADGSLLLATTQGILAFGAPAFPLLQSPSTDGACPLGTGVTVVVDLTAFEGGAVHTACAPGDPASGLEALTGAGFDVTTADSDFGTYVCAIEGLPELACDAPFEGQYWSYHSGNADGSWTSSPLGADSTDPAPGDIEGWAWSDGAAPSVPAPTGACQPAADGVTVVVDLTGFDGGTVLQGCAPGDPTTGLDALAGAGFDVTTATSDFGTYVCAIQGLPELACDAPFEGQYWSYHSGNADGSWTAHEVGADSTDPTPGDIEGWAWSDGAGPAIPAPGAVVDRIAGASRIDTAITASQDAFPGGFTPGAVLARADGFADALAGTPLALAVGGPLLTTTTEELPEAVLAEVTRAVAPEGTVYVLGGEAAVGPAVATDLEAAGFTVERLAGDDRFTTAIAVAEEVAELREGLAQVLLTTGGDFPDALAAGTAAAVAGDAAVLLTGDGTPHPAVEAWLADNAEVTTWAVGGPAAAAHPEATPVVGTSREATAVAVAQTFFDDPTVVGIARRDDFADALAGGVHIARLGGPLLITPTDATAEVVTGYVCATPTVTGAVVYGGTAAVGQAASLGVADAITGAACA